MLCVLVLLLVFQSGFDLEKRQSLTANIRQILQKNAKIAPIWAVSVRSESGEEIISENADVLVTPASNQKILTTAVVLDVLGSNYKFSTLAYLDGPVESGVLKGNLIIEGTGDPSINKTTFENPLDVLREIVIKLKENGISRIEGKILADVSAFDDEPYPEGWEWKDLTFYYGVEINPLSFNNNTVDLEVSASGAVGKAPKISWFPLNTNYVTFINRQVISEKGTRYRESYHRLAGSNTIVLTSKLPQGYLEKESLSIPDPAGFFVHTLALLAKKEGISVGGKTIESSDKKQIWELKSPPVSILVREVLSKSNNFYTEMLLKAAARKALNEPGSTKNGILMMKKWLADAQLDSASFSALDGSGLYAGALWTASGLSGTLHVSGTRSYAMVFDEAMAKPGAYGTLEKRFSEAPYKSTLIAKTGYVSGVRSLSGRMTTISGNRVSFSLVTNHYIVKTAVIDRIHEQLLNTLYEGF